MKVAAAAECMGAPAALVLQMVRLPEHRPFIADIFLFLLCSTPILLMFHMLPLCSENCAKVYFSPMSSKLVHTYPHIVKN